MASARVITIVRTFKWIFKQLLKFNIILCCALIQVFMVVQYCLLILLEGLQ